MKTLNTKLSGRTRRTAAMLCAVLAGLGLARGATAQQPQPPLSPKVPTPYQSPLFHGGGSDPALVLSPPTATAPGYGLQDPALLNPLYSQLQGTPTGLVANGAGFTPIQIPSFDLGAYSPGQGPAVSVGGYYPDHLADGSIYSWEAPFNYIPLSTGQVVVDDTSGPPSVGISGFTVTPNWSQQNTGAAAGTATGGEYYRLPPGSDGAATWTLAATTAGSYSVYFHIPDQIEDSAGVIEPRSTQVTYQIVVAGTNAQTATATVSQTEANSSQFLAGPFLLAVGDTVTVTLQRDNLHNQNTEAVIAPATTGSYLIADSMTLQTAIGDVRSTPTAINASAYPADFARAKYWGIFVESASNGAPQVAGTSLSLNANPDTTGGTTASTTPLFFYGDPTKTENDAGALDGPLGAGVHKRLIRQLVYFGRQDPGFSQGDTVDDSNPGFTSTYNGPFTDNTGTATNGTYHFVTPVSSPTGTGGAAARWTLVAPNGGDFYVSVHLPSTPTNSTQQRIPDAPYRITVNGTALPTQPLAGFQISQAQTGDVTLPTGRLALNKGDIVVVTLTAATAVANPNNYTVVADSLRLTTGVNGTGAIYCVDGFTGAVVWRFQTPGGLNGPSAAVFSAPVVTKINVLVTPAGPGGIPAAVYQNKLVVIVGDENGMVYCLDAIGNGDGTSNANAIDTLTGLPIYIPQPAYGAAPPTQVDAAGYTPHVGTTGAYWIYRPDPNQPKYVTGANFGKVKPSADFDVNSDLPVPAAFATASPTVFVDPTVSTTADPTTLSIPLVNGLAPSNAKVYVGNSNGVLYALDGAGVSIDGTSKAAYAASGDRFNASYDLRIDPTAFPAVAADAIVPTTQPLWWFTLRGADPNSTNNASFADIESAPALYTTVTTTSVTDTNGNVTTTNTYAPTVYIGSSHEVEATSNVGRLYALNGIYGPAGSDGTVNPSTQPDPTLPNYTGPGSLNYNIAQRPQINTADTTDWSFPDAYDRTTAGVTKGNKGQSSNKLTRPALGNVTGSPVVFTNTNETNATRRTRIYFAANVGLEVDMGSATGTAASARPEDTETGRIWAVNLDGSVGRTTGSTGTGGGTVWSYPLANDPNDAALDTTAEPAKPLGSFLHGTPAMGFVQFPATIAGYPAVPSDHVHASLLGQSIPMLYIATRGANDTALYAVDVDGDTDDQRLIYRQISPDGSIFQSSPALIANNSIIAGATGGNGGAVYVVSGNTLYDFSATPISNLNIIDPATGLVDYPIVRENRAYTGFGPLSSPTLAAADTLDLLNPVPVGYPYGLNNATDWIYVGDSSTGFCRGITPYDLSDSAIPTNLGSIIPPSAEPPGAVDLQAIMQVYLVSQANSGSTSAATPPALAVGPTAPLPVYDWGQSVYIRFKNVAPPADPNGGPDKVVIDSGPQIAGQPIQGYGRGGPIEFDLSDSTVAAPTAGTAAVATPADHGTVPAVLLPAATTPLGNGFFVRSDTPAAAAGTLVDKDTKLGYIGAYTYAISDGTARRNTPGSRRQIINAKQTVDVYTSTDGGVTFTPTGTKAVLAVQTTSGNLVTTPTGGTPPYALTAVQPVEEPTFGILNPLAVRGGGIPLALTGTTPVQAVQIGDPLGPFRGIPSTITDPADLEALANGNAVPLTAPNSTTGGGSPIRRNPLLTNPKIFRHTVVTSTGLISHNTSGDNFDVTNALLAPTGTGATGEGLTNPATNFGSQTAPYAAALADRSALGLRVKRLRVKTGTVSGGGAGLYWNDNSIPTTGHDHDSVVNFLPWETAPVGYKQGTNPSNDYPDIGTSDITATLHRYSGGTADLTLGNAIAEPVDLANGGADPASRLVHTNPIQFHVSIPHFQPANQQLYRFNAGGGYAIGPPATTGAGGEITPYDEIAGSSTDLLFPMGYVTTRRIYIPDQNGFYRPGAAYRDIRIYTGVPPDYSTRMDTPTADVGRVPSGFGVQTSSFPGLADANGIKTFDPYNLDFQEYYKPLTILNTGNVNLLNVHLDQKQQATINGVTRPAASLPLFADGVDGLSYIPAYDYAGAVTGPRLPTYPTPNGNVPEDFFLIRSSLDSDLVAAFGHNPAILTGTNAAGNPLLPIYPGATLHKAQVGSGQPSTLYVPDSPEGYTLGATLDLPPTNNPTHTGDTNNNGLPFKTKPFVSVAVPFGTPAGSYSASVQLFEGLDAGGYSTIVSNPNPPGGAGTYTGLTAQIFPPQYGGAIGGIGTPMTDPFGRMLDTIQTLQSGISAPISLMPNSATGTVLNVKVTEDRMTDGLTFGADPQIDLGPAIPGSGTVPGQSVPDFGPAGFRDPATGNLSVYWTSGRSSPGFGIYSATVPMLGGPNGAFMPVNPASPGSAAAPSYVNEWWTSLGNAATGYTAGSLVPAIPTNQGTNSGLTIAQDPQNLSNIAAFVVNVQAPPQVGIASYQNTLLYYPVTASNGALGTPVPITNDPTQVKYGVKGLFTNTAFASAPSLWAFWTATTRGRTAIYYNSATNPNNWTPATGTTIGLLTIPAGLTAVADAAPLLVYGNVPGATGTQLEATIEVTYSGTAPGGNVDLYQSRYQPDAVKAAVLDLVPYPAVTEVLKATGQTGGWYQAKDVAWSRTSPLNLFVGGVPILYSATSQPLFSRAVFDKASGLLALTGVPNPVINSSTGALAFPSLPATGTATLYIDLATGRARFSATPNGAAAVTASFSPLARRLTDDSRADTGPSTFLDGNYKANDRPGLNNVIADRRWYVWRKSGTGGASPSATIYYKTQRLTAYLPLAIDVTKTFAFNLNGTAYTNPVDVHNVPAVLNTDGSIKSQSSARLYFPIQSGAEGATITGSYTATDGTAVTIGPDTVQWQDEIRSNDTTTPPADAATGLAAINPGYLVPLDTTVNENNVTAFLDTPAYANTATSVINPHKVWLFWNSTRNGTADLYYETINPLFAPQ